MPCRVRRDSTVAGSRAVHARRTPAPPSAAWYARWLAAIALSGALGCADRRHNTPPPPKAEAPAALETTAFVDVELVSTADASTRPHQTVLIEGGTIKHVGDVAAVAVPPQARVIEGGGHYLLPGLADMHVHLPEGPPEAIERVCDLSLAAGITLVRSMQGAPSHVRFREQQRAQARPAPELLLAGVPVAEALSTTAAAALVREQKAAGYDFVKVLGGFDRPAWEALVGEGRRVGLPVCGHLPSEIPLEAALEARQQSIEHASAYDPSAALGEAALASAAEATRRAGVAVCPTLDYFAVALSTDEDALARREGLRYTSAAEQERWRHDRATRPPPPDASQRLLRRRQIVAALARAGALLLVGSDAPDPFQVPGFAYLEEVRQWSLAGLGNAQILRAATQGAAEYLGAERERGAVAAGYRADLVLLEKNPLESIENLAHPLGVMALGRWADRAELERRIARYRTP